MELFYGPVSGNSSRALFGLLESGVRFDAYRVDRRAGENRLPAYLARNPMGKVPALTDGAFSLWESNAINFYAAEKAPASGLLPKTPEGRASVLRWMFFQSAHVTPALVPVFRETNPKVRAYYDNPPPDPAGVEAAHKELQRFLPVLDAALAGKEWLEGDFSLADVSHAPHLVLAADGGLDLSQYAHLRAWLGRVAARPAWIEAKRIVFG